MHHTTQHQRIPALDGARGLAVAGVLAYHAGWSGATGGFLGVSLFFTLSGFLIVGLLLDERAATGTVDLGAFWSRRARRLLPAALAALGLAIALTALAGSDGQVRDLRGDVLAALGYVANWRFVLDGTSYAELGEAPSMLQHLWSLAIEEQLYVVLPLVVLAAGRRVRSVLVVALGLSVGALVLVSGDQTRAYFGTDTRAAEVLVGGLLAVWVRGRPAPGRLARAAGPLALAAVLWSWTAVRHDDPALYAGGLLAHAVLVAVVLRSATGGGLLPALLAFAPLRWLGRVSYGAYLYHWPVFLWLTPSRTLLDGLPLAALRIGASLALAEVSVRALEDPVRTGRRLRTSLARPVLALGFAAVALAAVAVPAPEPDPFTQVLAAAPSELIGPPSSPATTPATSPSTTAHPPPPTWPTTLVTGSPAAAAASVAPTTSASPSPPAPATTAPPPPAPTERLRVYVAGDSNALGIGTAMARWGVGNGIDVWTSGWLGCHLVVGGEYRYAGATAATTPKCDGWAEERSRELAQVRPHVTLVISGSFDLLDRRLPGSDGWQHVGQPAFDSLLRDAVARLTDLARRDGGRVVWATYPAIRTGTVDGVPPEVAHPENDPARVERLNRIVADVVASRPGASLVDLRGRLRAWPGGELDPARRPDGVHPTTEELDVLGAWMGQQLLAERSPG